MIVPNLFSVVLTDSEFTQFQGLIYRIAGISLSAEKKPLVAGRLAKRLIHYELSSYGEYYQLINAAGDQEELQMAVDLLTTNETHFFREPKHFDFLRQHILPARKAGKTLRIWSAACSTGEEPYSIAMLLDDTLGISPWEIVATDINTQVLEIARSGLYLIERQSEIPRHYLSKYCLKGTGSQEGTLLIERKLRNRVQFKQHNLIDPPPNWMEFDVIFLRNVMIYFNQTIKQKVVSYLLSLLLPGGYLFIGHSETLHDITEEVHPAQVAIYQKPFLHH